MNNQIKREPSRALGEVLLQAGQVAQLGELRCREARRQWVAPESEPEFADGAFEPQVADHSW